MEAKKDTIADQPKVSQPSSTETTPKKKKQEQKTQTSPKHVTNKMPYMQNRELSWLDFNKRVLDQGEDKNVPLLERLTFVSIFSSNLQEFFMVRVGSLTDLSLVKKELLDNKTLMTPAEQLAAIYEKCHLLYPDQERIFKNINKDLAKHGVKHLHIQDLDEKQLSFLHRHLEDRVMPYLSPQIINSRHPFPHLENGALYVLVRLNEEKPAIPSSDPSDKTKKKPSNKGADDATFGLIPLPRQANRIIRLPGEGTQFILLEDALKLVVNDVFSMYSTKRASVICITRNADIDPNEGADEIEYDYREHMKRILKKRARLTPVRLETDTPLSSVTEKFLLSRLNLHPNQVYVTSVPLDMGYAWALPDIVDPDIARDLTNTPFTPTWPACIDRNRSVIEQVCESDKLLSYPYESVDPFINLLREAAVDPAVLSIKITLYRLARQSHIAEAILLAAENGKEVTALFELRARFDESNNIEWSQRFEEAGANVIYGFQDYKVHSKICVVTRNTEHGLQYITQLGTGNYNEKTSKLYTDFSFITTDKSIGKDAARFFRNMSLENISANYQSLVVAPVQIKPMILEKIDEQIALAQAGKPNGIIFKTNSITDKDVIEKIVEASQAGVHTTMLVRGISCILPDVKGYTENVEIVSIVGRLLEHSRIYGFGAHDNLELYLSSADLMTRNMDKRVEIAWPLKDKAIRQKVLDYFDICLSDTAKLRKLQKDSSYTALEAFAQVTPSGKVESFDSQAFLINKAKADYEESLVKREEENIFKIAQLRAQMRDEPLTHDEEQIRADLNEHITKDQEEISNHNRDALKEDQQKRIVDIYPEETSEKVYEQVDEDVLEEMLDESLEAENESQNDEFVAIPQVVIKPDEVVIAPEQTHVTVQSDKACASAHAAVSNPAVSDPLLGSAPVDQKEQTQTSAEIQLVEHEPIKPGFFKRLKFLFTGHF